MAILKKSDIALYFSRICALDDIEYRINSRVNEVIKVIFETLDLEIGSITVEDWYRDTSGVRVDYEDIRSVPIKEMEDDKGLRVGVDVHVLAENTPIHILSIVDEYRSSFPLFFLFWSNTRIKKYIKQEMEDFDVCLEQDRLKKVALDKLTDKEKKLLGLE